MAIALRLLSTLLFLGLGTALGGAPARAQDTSPWSQGMHSRARLVSGGVQDGHLLAGIEIELDPGFKTYWRTPGDSGLPPRFDWSASENLADIELRWPAPARTEDAGGVAYTYSHSILFPVLVRAKEPSRPVGLELTLDYGVCKDICIPAHAEIGLALAARAQGQRLPIEGALARVPTQQPLGTPGPLSILSLSRRPGDKPTFTVETRPAGSPSVLFAEGPENWYLSTSPADGNGHFTVTVEERPSEASDVLPIVLTLTAGPKAIETQVQLDLKTQPR